MLCENRWIILHDFAINYYPNEKSDKYLHCRRATAYIHLKEPEDDHLRLKHVVPLRRALVAV